MDLTYFDSFVESIKFDESNNKSSLDLLLDLQSNFQKLKVEILTNKIRIESNKVNDYFELLIMILKDAKPNFDIQHSLVVGYWLDYYDIHFGDVIERKLPQDFTIFFSEDNQQNFKDNPAAKEFQIAFSNALVYKYYEYAQAYIIQLRFDFLNPKIPQNTNTVKNYYYNLFFNDKLLINYDNELECGFMFFNEVILDSIYTLLKNEIAENIIQFSETKINFYLDSLENNISNSGILDYPYEIHSQLEEYNESVDDIKSLHNKELYLILSYPRYALKSNISRINFDNIQFGLIKYFKSEYALLLLEFVNELKEKLINNESIDQVIEVNTKEEEPDPVGKFRVYDDSIGIEKLKQIVNLELPKIFKDDNSQKLFERIILEFDIVNNENSRQAKLMTMWDSKILREAILKKYIKKKEYLYYLNKRFDLNYKGRSTSDSKNYQFDAENCLKLHAKELEK